VRLAVVVAGALDKRVAWAPLFRGVSFKLERGDRVARGGPQRPQPRKRLTCASAFSTASPLGDSR
jgi:hypothetical protein